MGLPHSVHTDAFAERRRNIGIFALVCKAERWKKHGRSIAQWKASHHGEICREIIWRGPLEPREGGQMPLMMSVINIRPVLTQGMQLAPRRYRGYEEGYPSMIIARAVFGRNSIPHDYRSQDQIEAKV